MAVAPVLDFASKVKANGHRCAQGNAVRDWGCDVVAMLVSGQGCQHPPCVAHVHWAIDIDEVRQRYSFVVKRDDRSDSLVLRAGWLASETPEQRIAREAVMRVLAAVLAASYGIPG